MTNVSLLYPGAKEQQVTYLCRFIVPLFNIFFVNSEISLLPMHL